MRVITSYSIHYTKLYDLLERVLIDVPPPKGEPDGPLRALIFDSKFDQYRGVVCLVRVVDGSLKAGDHIQFLSTRTLPEVVVATISRSTPDTVTGPYPLSIRAAPSYNFV